MPVPGSGLGSQVGIAEETTWGTGVTVTRFIPHDSETLKFQKKPVQGMGLQAGAYTNLGQLRADTSTWCGGDVVCDFTSKQMGLLLKHGLGAVATVQNGATVAYTHTFTLGSTVLGKGLTVQVGRPSTDGTVVPYTYTGGKITSWSLAAAAQDIVKYTNTFLFKDRTKTTGLATASYPTASNVFHFKQGSLTVNGSAYAAFRDFTLSGDNGLAPDRFYFGNAGLLAEPVRKDFTKISCKGTVDFIDTTISDAYHDDSEVAIVLTFQGKQIVTGPPNYFETLTITLNGVRLNGDEPAVGGPDILNVALDADVLVPIGGGTQLSIAYTTLDATP